MKNLILTFALVFMSLSAFSQNRSDLQGPKYKNYKPWKNVGVSDGVYSHNYKASLKGLEYKNYKPANTVSEKNNQLAEIDLSLNKTKLTGPKYKNRKPWAIKKTTTVAYSNNSEDSL